MIKEPAVPKVFKLMFVASILSSRTTTDVSIKIRTSHLPSGAYQHSILYLKASKASKK